MGFLSKKTLFVYCYRRPHTTDCASAAFQQTSFCIFVPAAVKENETTRYAAVASGLDNYLPPSDKPNAC